MLSRTALVSLAVALTGSVVWAEGARSPFTEKRGVQEFTGTMLVRRLQPDVLAAQGHSREMVARIRQRAFDRLAPYTLRIRPETDWAVVRVPPGTNESQYSQLLMLTGDYEYAVPNWRCYPLAKFTPSDALFSRQWHHRVIKSEDAWGLYRNTSNVTIAGIDTGVMTNHDDLKALIKKGYNSVDRKAEVDGGQVNDINGHGTHVAGDAAAHGNNNIGVSGVGFNFGIIPVRCSNSPGGGASHDDMFDGAIWAVKHGARVVSSSYSGVDNPAIDTTGQVIKGLGGLYLYAAGNDNRNLSGFSYKHTIVVGSTQENDTKSGFSAYGRGVAVFAPGSNIWSTTNDGGYAPFSGTSMATPVANGVCAMIWSINPVLTPTQVQNILYSTCDQIGPSTIYGNGRVNVYRAVQSALASRGVSTDLKPNTLSVLQGSYYTGSLANVQNGTGVGYQSKSVAVNGVGESSVQQLTFKTTAPLHKFINFTPTFKASGSSGVNLTGQIFIWNVVAKKWDIKLSVAMPRDGSTKTFQVLVETGFSNYIATDGTIKTAVRLFSPVGRRGEPGAKFTEKLSHAVLRTRTQS